MSAGISSVSATTLLVGNEPLAHEARDVVEQDVERFAVSDHAGMLRAAAAPVNAPRSCVPYSGMEHAKAVHVTRGMPKYGIPYASP